MGQHPVFAGNSGKAPKACHCYIQSGFAIIVGANAVINNCNKAAGLYLLAWRVTYMSAGVEYNNTSLAHQNTSTGGRVVH